MPRTAKKPDAGASDASEKVLQTYAVSAILKLKLAGLPVLYAGDMSGNRRTSAEQLWAKANGLVAGEPDLRVYGPAGRTLFIEMKTATGPVQPAQVKRHAELRALGHSVEVVRASTGDEAARLVTQLVERWLGETPAPVMDGLVRGVCDGEGGEAG